MNTKALLLAVAVIASTVSIQAISPSFAEHGGPHAASGGHPAGGPEAGPAQGHPPGGPEHMHGPGEPPHGPGGPDMRTPGHEHQADIHDKMKNLSPEQHKALHEKHDKFKGMTPEERKAAHDQHREDFKKLPAEKQEAMKAKHEQRKAEHAGGASHHE